MAATKAEQRSCLLAQPGDVKTLCGKRRETVPVTWTKWALGKGWKPLWCEACFAKWQATRPTWRKR